MTVMYAWWQILRVVAMFQMIITGMALPTAVYNWWLLKNGGDKFVCTSLLKFGLANLAVDVVVFVWVCYMANRYECPLFIVYQIFYEYFAIGAGIYYLVHCGFKKIKAQ